MLAILGRSWASTGGPGPLLEPLQAVLAALGRLLGLMLAILGRSWASTLGPGALLAPLCAVLCRSWSLSWRSWPLLGVILAVLGRSWGLCGRSGAEKCEEHAYLENVCISRAGARSAAWGRSWAALGAYVGGLGPLLEPMLAVLGRSWDLCCRSWAALGAYAGGLAAMLEPKWSVLEGSGPKSGSGSAAVRRWDRPERWDRSAGPDRSEAQTAFFQYIYFFIFRWFSVVSLGFFCSYLL